MYYKYKIKLKDGTITEADSIEYTYNRGIFSNTLSGVMLYKDKYYDQDINSYMYRSKIFVPVNGYQELIAEQREPTKTEQEEAKTNGKKLEYVMGMFFLAIVSFYVLTYLGIIQFPTYGFAIVGPGSAPTQGTISIPNSISTGLYEVSYYNYTWMVPCGIHEGFYIIKNNDTQEILKSEINMSNNNYQLNKTSMIMSVYLNYTNDSRCWSLLTPSLVERYLTYDEALTHAKENVRSYHLMNLPEPAQIIPNEIESVPGGHGMDCEVMVNGTMVNGTREQCEWAARD